MNNIFSTLITGFVIGLSIAAPVGPIGVLCIRRTLADGRLAGFLSGLGAATADMIYGTIAAFGLSVIMDLLIGQANWLRLVGGIFLIYLGIRTLLSKPAEKEAETKQRSGLVGAYLSTLLLTLTNPMTILSFIAIFAGALPTGSQGSPLVLVAGVFTGSACWWLGLSFGVGLMRGKLESSHMMWINRLSGVIILGFGIFSLFQIH
jgi:threonine/homoserine/homoserine lactone efflux protein